MKFLHSFSVFISVFNFSTDYIKMLNCVVAGYILRES